MSASWASVLIAAIVAAAALARELLAHGKRDGKIDTVIEQLAAITADHEKRIRGLEDRPRHKRRLPPFRLPGNTTERRLTPGSTSQPERAAMQNDYHVTDPISLRPNPQDLAWLEDYAGLHGMSRNSAFNQALASFRMQGDAAGWNAGELLDMLRVVLEALNIPLAACVGDDEIRQPIINERTMILVVSLREMLDRGPDQASVPWTAAYIREQLAKHPATGYRTDYAQVVADRDGITLEAAREQLAAHASRIEAAQ